MTATLRIISPVDGSVYAERPLADDATVSATLERARDGAARRGARCRSPSACRIAHRLHRCDGRRQGARVGAARLADGTADPLRAGRGARLRGARPLHDRGRAGDARRHRCRAEGGLQALHPARAARRRPQSAGLELSLHDGAQRRAAGDPRRQHGGDEAFEPDRAGRRALRRLLREGESSQGRLPGPSHVA